MEKFFLKRKQKKQNLEFLLREEIKRKEEYIKVLEEWNINHINQKSDLIIENKKLKENKQK